MIKTIKKQEANMDWLRNMIVYPLPYNKPHPMADLLYKPKE